MTAGAAAAAGRGVRRTRAVRRARKGQSRVIVVVAVVAVAVVAAVAAGVAGVAVGPEAAAVATAACRGRWWRYPGERNEGAGLVCLRPQLTLRLLEALEGEHRAF